MKKTDYPANWDDLQQDEKIAFEQERLEKILRAVPKKQMAICRRLTERAAFMLVTLRDYEYQITVGGIITEMSQGGYSIQRENPAAKGYNTMLKNYQAIIKQLTELLPTAKDAEREKAGETLKQFVAAGKR